MPTSTQTVHHRKIRSSDWRSLGRYEVTLQDEAGHRIATLGHAERKQGSSRTGGSWTATRPNGTTSMHATLSTASDALLAARGER